MRATLWQCLAPIETKRALALRWDAAFCAYSGASIERRARAASAGAFSANSPRFLTPVNLKHWNDAGRCAVALTQLWRTPCFSNYCLSLRIWQSARRHPWQRQSPRCGCAPGLRRARQALTFPGSGAGCRIAAPFALPAASSFKTPLERRCSGWNTDRRATSDLGRGASSVDRVTCSATSPEIARSRDRCRLSPCQRTHSARLLRDSPPP